MKELLRLGEQEAAAAGKDPESVKKELAFHFRKEQWAPKPWPWFTSVLLGAAALLPKKAALRRWLLPGLQ